MRLPFFPTLAGYQPSWLRGDLLAGLTVWAVLVPESLAYAAIAGVPPVVGLYAAVPALVLYAALGSSRQLIVASMSATAALSASIVAVYAHAGEEQYVALTAALAVVTGIVGLLAGLLRLGFLASFISEPVLKGFIVGLALTIIVGQLPKLFGVAKGGEDFFSQVVHLLRHLGDTDGATLAVGLLSLAVVLGLRRWLPIVPGSLVAAMLGVVAVSLFDLADKGVEVVGHIDSGLPHLGLPQLDLTDYLQLVGASTGVLLIGFAEGLGAAKTYAAKAGDQIDANRELLGLGAANLGAGLASGMVVNGSLSKTAVNGGAGARSPVSSLTVAVLTVVTLLFLTGLFENLPEATLAAIVIAAVIELVDIPALVRLYRVWTGQLRGIYGWAARADFLAALAAMLGVLVFDTLPGLFIGIAVSLVLLLYRASISKVSTLVRAAPTGPGEAPLWLDHQRHPELTPLPGVLVVRAESGLFFANAEHVRTSVRAALTPDTRLVVLDASTTPSIDVTGTEMLVRFEQDLARDGIALRIAHGIGQTRDILRRAGEDAEVLQTIYADVDAAIAAPLVPPDAG